MRERPNWLAGIFAGLWLLIILMVWPEVRAVHRAAHLR